MTAKRIKSTNDEVLRRVHLVVRMLNDGRTTYQIYQYTSALKAKEERGESLTDQEQDYNWKVTERQVYEYSEKAYDIIDKLAMQSAETYYKQSLERLNTLYRGAIRKNNFHAALKAQEMIMRITGVNDFNKKDELNVTEGEKKGSDFILPNGEVMSI